MDIPHVGEIKVSQSPTKHVLSLSGVQRALSFGEKE